MTINTAANTLIITSAFYHPDANVRNRLRDVVDQWVAGLEPEYSDQEIRRIISGEEGTPLEPFVLNDADTDMAVKITMAAFSKKEGAKRFRIVSRDTIGFKGGLVITRKLKSYYAERYINGKYRRNPQSGMAFFPAYTPFLEDEPLVKLKKTQAMVETDEEGFIIKLDWPYMDTDHGLVARALQRNSRILSSDRSFDQLGLRVDVQSQGIEIRTGSPESQIKMAAHMMNHDVIRLSLGSDYPDLPDAQIVLELPEENATHLKTVFMTSEKAWPWLDTSFSEPIQVSKDDKLAIARWLPPHYSWLDEIWDELI